jgi:hypothetical protein
MKALMAVVLILFGALWSYYATLNASMMQARAMSDARQMEADLKAWAMDKVSEPELLEIFPENYALRLGGERKDRNFRKMIEDISISSAPPLWPGLLSVLTGLIGLVSALRDNRNKRTEQTGTRASDSR